MDQRQLAALESGEQLREAIGERARLRDLVLVDQVDVPLHAVDGVLRVEVDGAIGLDELDPIRLQVQPDLLAQAAAIAAAEPIPVMVGWLVQRLGDLEHLVERVGRFDVSRGEPSARNRGRDQHLVDDDPGRGPWRGHR